MLKPFYSALFSILSILADVIQTEVNLSQSTFSKRLISKALCKSLHACGATVYHLLIIL